MMTKVNCIYRFCRRETIIVASRLWWLVGDVGGTLCYARFHSFRRRFQWYPESKEGGRKGATKRNKRGKHAAKPYLTWLVHNQCAIDITAFTRRLRTWGWNQWDGLRMMQLNRSSKILTGAGRRRYIRRLYVWLQLKVGIGSHYRFMQVHVNNKSKETRLDYSQNVEDTSDPFFPTLVSTVRAKTGRITTAGLS